MTTKSYSIKIIDRSLRDNFIMLGLITAIAWPASLLTLASVLDNPWGVCCRRSAQIGRTLADVLLSRRYMRETSHGVSSLKRACSLMSYVIAVTAIVLLRLLGYPWELASSFIA